jgi:endonuclease YncB( thermonuclease family)
MRVTFRTGLCIFLTCMSLPAMGQMQDDSIWTSKPTRVDKAKQTYERLPGKTVERDSRTWIVVPERIKVLDNRSFSAGDTVYEFANLRPIPAKRYCRAVEGGRWPCGRMASIYLGNLVRAKKLLCDVAQSGEKLILSRCMIGTKDVAADIVDQGYGLATGDDSLLERQKQAQKLAAKGLWRNPDCTSNYDTC